MQRSITRQPSVAPECLVMTVRSKFSDSNIPDMPARILSRVAELQSYPPNAFQAETTQDCEIVGPGFETNNANLYNHVASM